MIHWLFNFVIVMITPIGLKTLNYKFYIIWVVTNLSFMIVVYVFYPETSRKSLEEIDLLFLKESEKGTEKELEKEAKTQMEGRGE
jgi:hypothetical protein